MNEVDYTAIVMVYALAGLVTAHGLWVFDYLDKRVIPDGEARIAAGVLAVVFWPLVVTVVAACTVSNVAAILFRGLMYLPWAWRPFAKLWRTFFPARVKPERAAPLPKAKVVSR